MPFGEDYQTEEKVVRNDRRFLGKQLDKETGLVCIGQRYLDPTSGRFTQPDPVGLVDPATGEVNQEMLANPQRLNRYVYALNNPYKYVDPDGRAPDILMSLDPMLYYELRADAIGETMDTREGSLRTAKYVQQEALTQISMMLGGRIGIYGRPSAINTVGKNAGQAIVRTTRNGDKAVRITKSDGSVIDISPKRVKEFVPNTHPKAPPGKLNKVKFDNAIPNSKGLKRLPTRQELKTLKKAK